MEKCPHCGRVGHKPQDCYYKAAKCFNWGKVGHIVDICKSAKKKSFKQKQIEEYSESEEEDETFLQLNGLQDKRQEKAMINVHINGKAISMEIGHRSCSYGGICRKMQDTNTADRKEIEISYGSTD